jgi:sugar O-acyltransferase (sialic acid O-acetyltransferase NeuD family)
MTLPNLTKPVIVVGAGGHGKVLIATLRRLNRPVLGILDENAGLHGARILGVEVLGRDAVLDRYRPDEIDLVNGIGSIRSTAMRFQVFEKMLAAGFAFASVVDPSSLIAEGVAVGVGAQVMAGAIIQPDVTLAANCIVNTGVIVEHDCYIGAHAHLAPRVCLSGGVHVGDRVHIGTGAIIIQGITIGADVVVAAGAVVVRDVPAGVTVAGVPATTISTATGE